MKKKFFAVAMATTMALSTAMTANAATISGAWWTAWTEGYELKDTLEFDIDVKNGGDAVWNNVAAVFTNAKTTGTQAPAEEVGESYKEYAVVRGDNWGWGGGDNTTVDGNDITYEGGIADLGDADFIATMKDCHIDATITKSGNDVTMVYNITGANGKTATRTAKFTSDMSAGAYVFFVCDSAEVTVTQVTGGAGNAAGDNNSGAATDTTKKDDTTAPTTDKKTDTTTPAADKKDDKKTTTTPQTGDVAPVAALASLAVVACAGVVVSRKKVTE